MSDGEPGSQARIRTWHRVTEHQLAGSAIRELGEIVFEQRSVMSISSRPGGYCFVTPANGYSFLLQLPFREALKIYFHQTLYPGDQSRRAMLSTDRSHYTQPTVLSTKDAGEQPLVCSQPTMPQPRCKRG